LTRYSTWRSAGLGIINIKDLFGAASVRERKRVELVCELVEWDPDAEYDRLGLDTHYKDLAGVPVAHMTPARSAGSVAEADRGSGGAQPAVAGSGHPLGAGLCRAPRRMFIRAPPRSTMSSETRQGRPGAACQP
jgi:hypothetical protein